MAKLTPTRGPSRFVAFDAAGKRWGFSIVFAVDDDAVEVRVIHCAQYDLPPEVDSE